MALKVAVIGATGEKPVFEDVVGPTLRRRDSERKVGDRTYTLTLPRGGGGSAVIVILDNEGLGRLREALWQADKIEKPATAKKEAVHGPDDEG